MHHASKNFTQTIYHHAIVVVAKCPIPGKSKTRLIPMLGEEGSARLAKAMLSDVLASLSLLCQSLDNNSSCHKVHKILFYAPADNLGRSIMSQVLQELNLVELDAETTAKTFSEQEGWMLMPMLSTNLEASDLSDILRDILQRTRQLLSKSLSSSVDDGKQGKIVFVGMDSPELPLEEIVASLEIINDEQSCIDRECCSSSLSSQTTTLSVSEAVLCPANDGGYGMLAVPSQAPTDRVFTGIRWSDPLTALGQLKALTDCGVPVRLGRMMNDIDEPDDLKALCQRLQSKNQLEGSNQANGDVLLNSSTFSGAPDTGKSQHTRRALQELKLLS